MFLDMQNLVKIYVRTYLQLHTHQPGVNPYSTNTADVKSIEKNQGTYYCSVFTIISALFSSRNIITPASLLL